MLKQFSLLLPAMILPITVAAVEMTDYIDPNSFYDEAYVTGQFSLDSGNQDQTSYQGTAFGEYDITYSTLPFTWNIDVDGQMDLSKGKDEGSNTQRGYDFFVAGDASNYFFPQVNQLFGFGSVELGYRRLFGSDEDDDPFLKLGGGLGFGRIINATPLADALRVAEALKEYGILARDPSDTTYLAMAAVIAREGEFKSRFGIADYKQAWISEIEKILQGAGVLRGNSLGAAGVIKIHEILLQERVSIREHGWRVKGGIGYVASNYDGSDSNPSLDASFEYALPVGHRFQFINLAQYSTILDDDVIHRLSNKMSGTYEVSDRIDWENLWRVDMTFPSGDDTQDLVFNQLRSVFHYYLSNRISADFSLTFTHVEDDVDDNGNDDIDTSVFMGVTYRLR